jgi:hypothetical protein
VNGANARSCDLDEMVVNWMGTAKKCSHAQICIACGYVG